MSSSATPASVPQAVSDERARMRAACAAAGGPGTKEGWAVLWRENMTMWDLKGPTKVLSHEFTAAVCDGRVQLQGSALVPGCGTGYDVKMLASAGMKRVVGLDITEEALVAARAEVGSAHNAELICGDFFTDTRLAASSFSFIFDYTFFCAINHSARAAWGRRTAELLAPNGRLLTLAFPLASDEVSPTCSQLLLCSYPCIPRLLPHAPPHHTLAQVASDPATPGPPHAVSLAEYRKALEPHGLVLESGPYASPHSVRQNEQVIWWVKRS
jgi:SAM-dependent methyltransferase